ncbi:MAG: nucleotide exchange factor GrpE [Candidatus Liberibacter ctenarytainae]|uniref:Protein GrpE n=1 Tax=Candidatus Liberibacter ctenarytainae TaxID=2020335 RepID=A0A937DLP4_9HYPH|nr:nucleotide exchange factor GrpE [Candidatus Liberibacter ctenarytainae]
MNDEKIANANHSSDTNTVPIEEEKIANPIEEAEAKAKESHEKYLRSVAEMENLRRRTEREIQDVQSYAIASFARDMLSVSDNLSRALDSIPADTNQTEKNGITSLIDGIKMTKRDMISTLEKYGIKKIEADGQKFNPNFHQAMFEEINETIPTNTVIKVVQEGYTMSERVLRPALVGISKGSAQKSTETDLQKSSQNDDNSPALEKE